MLAQLISAQTAASISVSSPTEPASEHTAKTSQLVDKPNSSEEQRSMKQTVVYSNPHDTTDLQASDQVDVMTLSVESGAALKAMETTTPAPFTAESADRTSPLAPDTRRRATIASVYLPCVTPGPTRSSLTSSASLSSVGRLLNKIDFRAVLERGADNNFSVAAPSASTAALLEHFRQQARIASQWRKQQTAHWTGAHKVDDSDYNTASGSRISKSYGDLYAAQSEEKQQLTISSHSPVEHEQLVKPVTSQHSVGRQSRLQASNRASRKSRQ